MAEETPSRTVPEAPAITGLESLTDEELAVVVRAGHHQKLPADWSLMWERTEADKAYLIVDGWVSVRQRGQEIARLGPGDVIGEVGLLEHRLRTATVLTLTEVEVIHFGKEVFEGLLDRVPAFADALRATAASRNTDG